MNSGFANAYAHWLEQIVRIGGRPRASGEKPASFHQRWIDGSVLLSRRHGNQAGGCWKGISAKFRRLCCRQQRAVGGIVVPSGIYAFINWDDASTLRGWAIPSATDIAFALGALALVGTRAPASLKVFLLTLATFDDLAAIIIIALFYSTGLSLIALTGAAVCLVILFVCNRMGVERVSVYIAVGLVLWLFVLESGVHATLAGVALGLLIPNRRSNGTSLLHDIEEAVHPYVKFIILPLFAFANAGLPLDGFSVANLMDAVPLGIVAGLVIGKPVGILLTCAAMIMTGLARLPDGATVRHLIGVSCLAGIGFTMSLFIGSLAFAGNPDLESHVRTGVIAGSLLSIILGLAILATAPKQS